MENFPMMASGCGRPSDPEGKCARDARRESRGLRAPLLAGMLFGFGTLLPAQTILNPTVDSFVRDGSSANNNYGVASTLEVRTSSAGNNRDAYFKFVLSGIANVGSARLRIYAALSASGMVRVNSREAATGKPELVVAGNSPPTVSITSPVNGATFTAPADIPITATASDSDGSVAKVDVTVSRPRPPTTWVRQRPPTNSPPTVSITNPVNGATFTAPADITLDATASNSDGTISKVEFFQNGFYLGEDTTPPYSLTLSGVWAGSYALTARATDNSGDSTTSAAVNVIVNSSPTVSITSPAAGTVFAAPANIPITATASDSDGSVAKVEFFQGATKLGEALSSPYSYTWGRVAAGSYSLTAKATDNLGATTTSTAVNVIVNSPPTVSITGPVNGATFAAPASIPVTATASDSDGSVVKVEFFQGAAKLGEDATSPYSFLWSGAAVGSYSLTARATDNLGATTTSTAVNVTVSTNSPPTVSITSPAAGTLFAAPANILITATASDSDGSVAKVEFFQGATKLGESTTSPYSFLSSGAAVGSYSLTAKATDNLGALTTSGAVSITVNSTGVPTQVSGTISTSTTWTVAGSPYVLTGSVNVSGSPAPTLTIQAGVTVKGNSGSNLVVSWPSGGVLVANGTAPSPILFTANGSTTPGFWAGLYLGSNTPTASQISYATVEYGGLASLSRGGIYIENTSPTIDHVTVRNSLIAGITVNGGSPSVTSSTFSNNSGPAITLTAKTTLGSCSGLVATGNTIDGIEMGGATVDVNTTWKNTSLPFIVTGAVYVEKNGTPTPVLTIEPGVTVKFNAGLTLKVGSGYPGTLSAVGTSGQPITFTANSGSPTAGFWNSLLLGAGVTATTIAYATVSYGGSTAYTYGGVTVEGSAPTLDHVTLSNNAYAGVRTNGATPTIANCAFSGNTAGIVNQTPTVLLDAKLNWWNATSGPSGSGPGSGQSITGGVLFDPWLTASASSPEYISAAAYTNGKFNPSAASAAWSLSSSQSASWTLIVSNSQSQVVRTLTASGLTAALSWDGDNGFGVLQPDGTYTYTIQATSGSSATPASGRAFVDSTLLVNITSPTPNQTLSNVYQNGVTDVLVVGTVRMAGLTSWALEYGPGSSPSSWTTIASGTLAVVANTVGTWATGSVAAGLYSLRMRAYDDQANIFSVSQPDTVGNFSASQNGSELNAASGGSISYTSVLPFTLTENLVIRNLAGQTVRTLFNAQRSAGTFTDVWNGRNDAGVLVPNGTYAYVATVSDGNNSLVWDLSLPPNNPTGCVGTVLGEKSWSTSWDPFNNIPYVVTYGLTAPEHVQIWTCRGFACLGNSYVAKIYDSYDHTGDHTFTWMGTDSSGRFLPFAGHLQICRCLSPALSPNYAIVYGTAPTMGSVRMTPAVYDPTRGSQSLDFEVGSAVGGLGVTVQIVNQASASVLRTFTQALSSGHATLTWDGRSDNGLLVAPGYYTAIVTVNDALGSRAVLHGITTVMY
ncbi:MAG: Ig-like domain-containing protein [Thermoanaerobaculia bacterium]